MTKYAGLAAAVEAGIEKKALNPVVRHVGSAAMTVGPGVAFAPSDHASLNFQDPVAQKPWYRTGEGLANVGDWTIGFIPGVGSLWSLGRAGWAAMNGNWGEAGLHALGAVPFAGRGRAAAAKGTRAAVAASRLAGAAGKIPLAGLAARNPKAVGTAAKVVHDWYGIDKAHQMASDRRAGAAQQATQSQQQQPSAKPVKPITTTF